jgi:hypothetical protein
LKTKKEKESLNEKKGERIKKHRKKREKEKRKSFFSYFFFEKLIH